MFRFSPMIVKDALVWRHIRFLPNTHITALEIWKSVAARQVFQRAGIRMNRLERHPDAAHEARRFRVEMHRIAVDVLLGSHREI